MSRRKLTVEGNGPPMQQSRKLDAVLQVGLQSPTQMSDPVGARYDFRVSVDDNQVITQNVAEELLKQALRSTDSAHNVSFYISKALTNRSDCPPGQRMYKVNALKPAIEQAIKYANSIRNKRLREKARQDRTNLQTLQKDEQYKLRTAAEERQQLHRLRALMYTS